MMARMVVGRHGPVIVPNDLDDWDEHCNFLIHYIRNYISEFEENKQLDVLAEDLDRALIWSSCHIFDFSSLHEEIEDGDEDAAETVYNIFKRWVKEIEEHKPPSVEDFL